MPLVIRRRLLPRVLAGSCLAVVAVGFASGAPAVAGTSGVYQWGYSGRQHSTPSPVSGLPAGITAVQAANWGALALDGAGNVWAWGRNPLGEFGNGTRKSSYNRAVEAEGPTHVVSIGEGNNFSAAVDGGGNVWVWGWNGAGQICLPYSTKVVTKPEEIPGLHALAVAGGGHHLLILLADGTVDACGINSQGQLGTGSFHSSPSPAKVAKLSNVVAISAGNMISEALESDGSVWAWGYDRYGQIGVGSTRNMDSPQHVVLPAAATEIYAGGDYPNDGHMLALLSNGQVMSWGDNAQGQLGIGSVGGSYSTPQTVAVPNGETFTFVAAGGADSFAIDSTGGLWAWGGRPGNLGAGSSTAFVPIPMRVASGFSLLSATSNEAVGYSTGP
jgi:alpha-tubulin suppressor-like RCC1 family protein